MEKEGHAREAEELVMEEEGEAEEVGLLVRGSKSNVENGISKEVRNGHVEENVYEDSLWVTENGAQDSIFDGEQQMVEEDVNPTPAEEGVHLKDCQPRLESCVYYDKDEDVKESSLRNPGVVSINGSLLADLHYHGNLKDENLSSLPTETSPAVRNSSTVEEIETAVADLTSDTEIDTKDYDVENVLQTQNTHDLYCPSCHSCITRRVVLRKRKRKIRISSEDFKPNKLQTAIGSECVVSHTQLTSEQGHDDPLISLEDTPISSEPEIFRCLSCFRFFIPTGSGFKVFRGFGERGDKENMRDGQEVKKSKSWFSSIFASNKGKEFADQVDTNHQLNVSNDIKVNGASNESLTPADKTQVSAKTLGDGTWSSTQTGLKILITSTTQSLTLEKKQADKICDWEVQKKSPGKDTVITVEEGPSAIAESMNLPNLAAQIRVVEQGTNARQGNKIEILKSIVYGGLAVLITSLSVVSSAAGGGTPTLYILAMGVANLIGGLFIILSNLWELKKSCLEQASDQIREQADRYRELLGNRENFMIHAVAVLLSYTLFGLVPPAVYGFSFYNSDDSEFKLVAAAATSLLCITVLAAGRVYAQRPPKSYLKTIVFYVVLGFMVSVISFAAGELINMLLQKLRLFQLSSGTNLYLPEVTLANAAAWASN